MKVASRIWRSAVIVACFVAFGVGGTLLSAAVFPIIILCSASPQDCHRRSRRIVGYFFRRLVGILRGAGCMRLEADGLERIADLRGALILANHPTYIDVVVLLGLAPHCTCVVKGAVWRNPFYWSIVRAAGYINNASPDAVVDQCAAALAAGESLVLFPEGTRTTAGQPLHFLRGAAHVELKARAPILPVLIYCDPPTLHKQTPWWLTSERPFSFRLLIQDALPLSFFVYSPEQSAMGARRLTAALEAHFSLELTRHRGPNHA